jgi:septal ring factor EnvC (AmiA/AmiB activator)
LRNAHNALAAVARHDIEYRASEDRRRKAERDRYQMEINQKKQQLELDLKFKTQCTQSTRLVLEKMEQEQEATSRRLAYVEHREDNLKKEDAILAQAELHARQMRADELRGRSAVTNGDAQTNSCVFQCVVNICGVFMPPKKK